MKHAKDFNDLLSGQANLQSGMTYFQNANAVVIGNMKSMKD